MSGVLGMMLASLGGAGIVTVGSEDGNNFGSGVTIDKPAGTLAADLLLSIIGGGSGVTWTGDTGWTELADYGSSPALRVARKTAGGSEPSDYHFDSSGAAAQGGVIFALRNAAFAAIGAFAHSTGGDDLIMPGITMSGDGILVAAMIGDSRGRTFSTPAGMQLVAELSGPRFSGSFTPNAAIFAQNVGAGATGSRTSSPSGGTSTGILIGIKEA